MKRVQTQHLHLALFFALETLFATPLFAGLGGDIQDLASETKAQAGCTQKGITKKALYQIYEFECEFGKIRQYVDPEYEFVFAVAWDGIAQPDLTLLLGEYSDEKLQSQGAPKGSRRKHSIQKDDLVLEKWGRARNIHGRAYDSFLLPDGVKSDEIL